MVDSARQLLDELMGRNRNIDPTSGLVKELHWQDPENCLFFLVQFCPHELFINTKADLGACRKVHDEAIKKLYAEAEYGPNKKRYEEEFLRFCNNMLTEVDRKIQKGKQRLAQHKTDSPPQQHASKLQEQLNKMNDRIKKLVSEAEEAGTRGDVDQAQDLMLMCDDLKAEREGLLKENKQSWPGEVSLKLMEVCEVCGAFLIVGDAQQRIEDHLTGKQHLGYAKLRKAVEELYERRRKRSGGDSDSNCSGSNRAGSERRRGAGDGERRGKSYGDADRNRNDRRDNHRDGSYRSRGGGDRYERDNHRQRNRRGDSRRRSRSRS